MPCPLPPANSIGTAVKQATTRLTDLSPSPRLDAELLLAHCLRCDRSHLRAWPERLISAEHATRFWQFISQRAEGIPLAYLTGEKEFWSRTFRVTPSILIPRPDTETLIEAALAIIPPEAPWHILDMGSGSGIIAITLAMERPNTRVLAIDCSPEALAITRGNADRYQLQNLEIRQSHWFSAIARQHRFDLIASNPPYLAAGDPHLSQDGIRHEPLTALVSGPKGLDDLTLISREAPYYLRPGGVLLLEHGYDQAQALRQILTTRGYHGIQHHADLQGHPRITRAYWHEATANPLP